MLGSIYFIKSQLLYGNSWKPFLSPFYDNLRRRESSLIRMSRELTNRVIGGCGCDLIGSLGTGPNQRTGPNQDSLLEQKKAPAKHTGFQRSPNEIDIVINGPGTNLYK